MSSSYRPAFSISSSAVAVVAAVAATIFGFLFASLLFFFSFLSIMDQVQVILCQFESKMDQYN